jgi:hypothetical protein
MTSYRKTKPGNFNGRPFLNSSSLPDIKIETIKALGSIYLLNPSLKQSASKEIVDKIIPMQRDVGGLSHGQVMEQLIINRLEAPCPLVNIETWATERCIEEIYKIPPEKLNDDRIGRTLDAVADYISDIEDNIVLKVLTHFQIKPRQILWDTTSFYFEGNYEESDIITFGYSRDQKKDKKQAVVELNITAKEGIPVGHRLLPGNASDKKEAVNNLEKMRSALNNKDIVVIGDRAMLTKPNIIAMQDKGIKFLGPLSSKERELILSIPDDSYHSLSYTTSQGKGGYSGVEIEHIFSHCDKPRQMRAVKNRLKIRPIFLQSDARIKSLVFVNILALIVYSLTCLCEARRQVEWICQREKLATSGKNALDIFRSPAIITLTYKGQTVQQIGNVSSLMKQIMEALQLGPPDVL